MTNIKFIRIIRKCGHNEHLIRAGETAGLIYDFEVEIAGERRALFSRRSFSTGYELYDADHRPIVTGGRTHAKHLGDECPNKASFEPMIAEYLAAGHIPTIAQMAAKRAAEAADQAAAEAAERANVVQQAGLAL
jgi:hypothetical protein